MAGLITSTRQRVTTLEDNFKEPTWGDIQGTLASQTDLQTALGGKAATVHTHDASAIVSGTIASARLGSGTANNTTYLRGDGTWQPVSASGGGAWGDITGTLSAQIDLQAALDAKQAAGSYQPLATVLTNTTASFTTAQETKLSGVATGATANSSDAFLLSRANHTGAQAISSVTGLQAALDGKQPLATVLTNTTAAFTTAQETKLSGIATSATKNGYGAATIDFGAFPGSNEASVTFTNADVGAAAVPFFASDDTTADHTANDHKYAAMLVHLSAQTTVGVGGVIHARSEHKMQGTFDVRYGY